MFVLVNARFLLICTALLLFANGTRADDGRYQPTKDGKTYVWNNRPRPGDVASWSGKRDDDGYATGYGTLTWYSSQKKIVTGSNLPMTKHAAASSYSGKMVDGKFEGPVVNVDANGRTFHGTFADGHKTKDWTRGPASSRDRMDIAAARKREENVRPAEVAEAATETEPEPPTEGPAEETKAENVQPPTPNAESIREQGVQHPTAEAPAEEAKAENVQRPTSNVQRPIAEAPAEAKKPEVITQKSQVSGPSKAGAPAEGIKAESVQPASARDGLRRGERPTSESIREQGAQHSIAEAPAEGPPDVQRSEVRSQKSEVSGPQKAKEPAGEKNGSLRSLIAPPASLRVNLPDEPPAPEATTSQAAAPPASIPQAAASTSIVPSLTGPEVIALADAEARRQGYNVRTFKRSRADYTAANETWSVSYDQTDAAVTGKHFSVTVEDKTKKTEIRK
jgi:hypothetical protein